MSLGRSNDALFAAECILQKYLEFHKVNCFLVGVQ